MTAHLTKLDEFVLLGVARTMPDSFGVRVAQEVPHATVGGVYACLAKLEARGILSSTELAPKAVRGGRRRKAYEITEAGRSALRRAMRDAERMQFAGRAALSQGEET